MTDTPVSDIFNQMDYTLRDANTLDFEFLRQLHRLTLKPYVTQIWGWDEEQQERLLRARFDPAKLKIIKLGQKDIGVLQVETRPEEIFLANVLLLPECQGKGLGTEIVRDIIQSAGQLSVTLTVLKPNPAKKLYERLGFETTAEDDVRFFMKRAAD
ncbi:MAG: GNAT family N-acetyltransferase [Bdellovibrionaceae bacterium]|nr:GNAT family N-acetyltransferase [Pseudobdellovibrionaceae bacterium]